MRTLILAIAIFTGIVFGLFVLLRFILKKLGHSISPYPVFGISVILCGLLTVGAALYDILTPGGDLNGMLGQILLMLYVPTVVVLLAADGILWYRAAHRKQDPPHSKTSADP